MPSPRNRKGEETIPKGSTTEDELRLEVPCSMCESVGGTYGRNMESN